MCATRLSSIRCLYGIQDVQIIFHRRIACIGTFLYKVMAMLQQLVAAIESISLLYDCIYNSVLCTCILYVAKLYGQGVICIVIQTSGTEFTVFTFGQANVVC